MKRMIQVTNKTVDDVMPKQFIPFGLDSDETQFIKDGYYIVRYFNKICFQNKGLRSTLVSTYASMLREINQENKTEVLARVSTFLSSIENVNCDELKQYITC